MRFYGLLTKYVSGVQYIFLIIDNFTKYVKLYKLKKATTNAALKKITEYINTFGKPKYFYIDNGLQFTAKKWQSELAKLGVKPNIVPYGTHVAA